MSLFKTQITQLEAHKDVFIFAISLHCYTGEIDYFLKQEKLVGTAKSVIYISQPFNNRCLMAGL